MRYTTQVYTRLYYSTLTRLPTLKGDKLDDFTVKHSCTLKLDSRTLYSTSDMVKQIHFPV